VPGEGDDHQVAGARLVDQLADFLADGGAGRGAIEQQRGAGDAAGAQAALDVARVGGVCKKIGDGR
jgi:hypothetical protein